MLALKLYLFYVVVAFNKFLYSIFNRPVFNRPISDEESITDPDLIHAFLSCQFEIEPHINKVKYYKYRSAITKFRISAHSLPIERGRWTSAHRNKRICPLCIRNGLGDTNINLVEIREKFSDEIYKMSPEIVPKTELCFLRLTKLILSDKCEITWTTTGKFLSKLLTQLKRYYGPP